MVMLMRGREFASKARTKKIIADRARQKILLPVPVLAGKHFGGNVTGPKFFCTNRFCREFFCRSNPMGCRGRVGRGRVCMNERSGEALLP